MSCHDFWFRFFKNFLFIKKQTTHFALPTKCQSVFVWSTSKPKKGWSTFATTHRGDYWYYKWHQSKINCKINNVDDDDSEHPIIVLSWICDCLFWSQKRLHTGWETMTTTPGFDTISKRRFEEVLGSLFHTKYFGIMEERLWWLDYWHIIHLSDSVTIKQQ